MPTTDSAKSHKFTIGISLALLSSLFIGSSFILKKKGLLKLTNHIGSVRAGSGGFGYLYEIQWWAGLISMGIGEACNFAAYGFAPASVVTPLGALSVLVSALMAVRFLNENLSTLGKIGCLLTISGSIILVIHAPKDNDVNSLLDFSERIGSAEFLFFSLFTCGVILLLIFHYAPRLGTQYVSIYILICSLLGAFTVTACKGLATGLKEFYTHKHTYSIWLTFFCAITIIACIFIQMVYLNKALDIFSTPIVTTVYYVLFTTCVLITSGILFREWRFLAFVDILACLVGFVVITCGLVLMNYLKTITVPIDTESIDMNDESLLSSFSSNSQFFALASSDSTTSTKQPNYVPIKSYSNLLLDDNNFSVSMNIPNEHDQSILLMNDCDMNL
ncbi:hypothetical protein I4U23_021341 [Adineta vaga]|nr:hypothetical protein I4U23_021341 [Adineta vaga]